MHHPSEDTICDVCRSRFAVGEWWTFHYRLNVYVHSYCAARHLVRGEDISAHTVLVGQMPEAEA